MDIIKDSIRTVPDFPIPGIQFRDITSLLEDPTAFNYALLDMMRVINQFGAEQIIGIESRGFVFGAPLAWDSGVPFIMARKPGKLPNDSHSIEYDLEYGSTSIEIQKNTVINGKVAIVDDLIATGGTAIACADIVHTKWNIPKEDIFIVAVVNLPDLGGSEKIKNLGYAVTTLVDFEGE